MPTPVTELATFDPFTKEAAYIHVNERLVRRILRRFKPGEPVRLLDVASSVGLMTGLAFDEAAKRDVKLQSTLIDIDRPALQQAKIELGSRNARFIFASAGDLPLKPGFDAAIFANSLHLLDDSLKVKALAEVHRVLRPGAPLAFNSTFYDGAYPEESKPFYSRWIRRSIVEVNRRLPNREKSDKVQAMEWLSTDQYRQLVTDAGFKVVEVRERRVLLSQAAVRAICAYAEFAKGALHATDEDAAEAAKSLQVTVRQTFHDLQMKYLPRNWLEIISVRV